MSIQQSFNQMLFNAKIGAGLYASTPYAEERRNIKLENKEEKMHRQTLADYEETHKDLYPEELPAPGETERVKAEKASQRLADITEARYRRNPTAELWQESYLAGVTADEYKRLGGSSKYINELKAESRRVEEYRSKREQKERFKERYEWLKNSGIDANGVFTGGNQ